MVELLSLDRVPLSPTGLRSQRTVPGLDSELLRFPVFCTTLSGRKSLGKMEGGARQGSYPFALLGKETSVPPSDPKAKKTAKTPRTPRGRRENTF